MSSFQDKDYYSTLGLDSSATQDQIKASYKKLALLWHPDRNKEIGADEMFKMISEAYEVLTSPEKKERYDLYLNSRVPSNHHHLSSSTDTPFAVHFGPNFEMTFTGRPPSSYLNRSAPTLNNPYYSRMPPPRPTNRYSTRNLPPTVNVTGVVNISKNGVKSTVSDIKIHPPGNI